MGNKETLEEAAEKFRSENPGTMQGGNNTKILNAFKNGAKWQQERMYSEEDMYYSFEAGKKLGEDEACQAENNLNLNFEKFIENYEKSRNSMSKK